MTLSSQSFSAQSLTLAVCRLDNISMFAGTAGQCLKSLIRNDTNLFSKIAESDPAAALLVLNLARKKKIRLEEHDYSIASVSNQLDKDELLRAVLNARLFSSENSSGSAAIREMIRSGLTTALAGQLIAAESGKGNQNAVYLAGLLCNIGRFALAELFPKTLLLITAEAEEQKQSIIQIERDKLKTDEIILGKRLAEKWHFPKIITEAIWLQATNSELIVQIAQDSDTASIVRLAGLIAKQELPATAEAAAEKLSLSNEQINLIRRQLPQKTAEKSALIALDSENPTQLYYDALRDIAIKSIPDSRKNDDDERYLQFVEAFAEVVNFAGSLLEAGQIFGEVFSKIFSVKKMCLYLNTEEKGILQAVYIEEKTPSKTYLLKPGEEFSVDKAKLNDLIPWFFEQTNSDFNLASAGFCRLQRQDGAIGGFIYETDSTDEQSQRHSADLAAIILTAIETIQSCKLLVEFLVNKAGRAKSKTDVIKGQVLTEENRFESVAELAAGAAHELNNPLAVISGRVQMLADSEENEARKAALNQITDKIKDIEEIVGGLMAFARPAAPQIRTVSPFILINNCLEKVARRYGAEPLEIKIENIEILDDIKIDTEQVARAFGEIIFNSLESYESGNGPVIIAGSEPAGSDVVQIKIIDSGCGMSEETLSKAAEPFYSAKPAGRQRGMGLTGAKRLLELNNCTIKISSEEDKGTIVIISLPKSI